MTKNVHDPAQSKIINMRYVQNTLGKGIQVKTGAYTAHNKRKRRECMTYAKRHKLVMPVYARAVVSFRWSCTVCSVSITRTHRMIKIGIETSGGIIIY